MPRYIVKNEDQSWFVVDTLSAEIIKKYSFEATADEVAELKNYDDDQEIFAEFG